MNFLDLQTELRRCIQESIDGKVRMALAVRLHGWCPSVSLEPFDKALVWKTMASLLGEENPVMQAKALRLYARECNRIRTMSYKSRLLS